MEMDLTTALCTGIATLGSVIGVLWIALRGVERRFSRRIALSEEACRIDLEAERTARKAGEARMHELEKDFRAFLMGEQAKTTQALCFVGGKVGELVERMDLITDRLGLPPRPPHTGGDATTVRLQALTGGNL